MDIETKNGNEIIQLIFIFKITKMHIRMKTKPLFLCYPKCTTCQKAAKWLKENGIDVDFRDIVLNNPKKDEIRKWIGLSGMPTSKFFNTSGLRYKALNLKEVVKTAPQETLIDLLASEGMLVKRPILITDARVLVGFKEDEWVNYLVK